MRTFLTSILVPMILLTGCGGQEDRTAPLEISAFVEELQQQGVDGSLYIRNPNNEDMEYIAEYTIARYSSTRIISLFKCKDAERAERNFRESLKNTKLSGQARNGAFIMTASFYPPDAEAVEKIRAIFLAHEFK